MNRLILTVCLIIATIAVSAQNNKFRPGQLWLDNNGVHINAHGGGILHINKRYYWFGEHKTEGELGNKAQVGVHCYSSTDLYNWVDEGIALSVVLNDSTNDIAKGCIIERPKVIYNASTAKYVMYFHLELKDKGYDAARAGVAISDKVTGPYTYLKSFRPDAGFWPINIANNAKIVPPANFYDTIKFNGGSLFGRSADDVKFYGRDFKAGQMCRDMTLFVDDDGTAYHLFASEENSTIHISQLSKDYLSHVGKYSRIFPGAYREAPAICKYLGKYYLFTSGCTGWAPNAAMVAIADNIFGPYTELGNPCIGPESATTFKGQSTFILPVATGFIFMADIWNSNNAIDGRYVWLPIKFNSKGAVIKWYPEWDFMIDKE